MREKEKRNDEDRKKKIKPNKTEIKFTCSE